MNLWIIFFTIITATSLIIYVLAVIRDKIDAERGTAELTEEDRNLLRRHIRALEDNTASNKRGRP